VKLNSGQPLQK